MFHIKFKFVPCYESEECTEWFVDCSKIAVDALCLHLAKHYHMQKKCYPI